MVETSINTDVELPPLMGLSSFGRPTPGSETTAEPETGIVVDRVDSLETSVDPEAESDDDASGKPEAPAPTTKAPAPQLDASGDWILLAVAGIGLLGIFALSLMIMKQ